MTTTKDANKLKAAGWRNDGDKWFPPWPSKYSYTLRAAVLEQASVTHLTSSRRAKRLKALVTI